MNGDTFTLTDADVLMLAVDQAIADALPGLVAQLQQLDVDVLADFRAACLAEGELDEGGV